MPKRSFDDTPRLAYHPGEVAEMHGISLDAVLRAIADGLIPVHKFGGIRLILADDAGLETSLLKPLEFLDAPSRRAIPAPPPPVTNRHWKAAGVVYFVKVADTVKIGFSTDATARIRKLRTGVSTELRLIHTVVGTRETERFFHHKFSAHRLSGEWFRLTGSLWEWLSGVCSLGDETDIVARRLEKRLTSKQVESAKPGRWPDGGGLYLDVDAERKRWLWRYRFAGRRRDMGLGSSSDVTLAQARAERDRWRAFIVEGKDPIDVRAQAKGAALIPHPKLATFGEVATAYLAEHEQGWRNEKHRAQWRMTLEVHAKKLWTKPVAEVSTAHILEVLKPIWQETPETASRLRGRIEAVLDAAQALGHVEEGRANPARWKGHLAKLLAKRQRLSRGHHAAMAFVGVPEFVASLRVEESIGARALEFLILTAARTGEVIGATWEEIAGDVWTVPKERMKAGREHRVPLSSRALEVLRDLATVSKDQSTRPSSSPAFVFPGLRPGRPQSNMVFAMALRRRGLNVTAHGFRSSFRDWAGDETTFPRELIEAALSHVIGDKAEQAYRRSDAIDRRRELMDAWNRYLEGSAANVIRLRG
jgi:integrase